jgi:hypothetical protein
MWALNKAINQMKVDPYYHYIIHCGVCLCSPAVFDLALAPSFSTSSIQDTFLDMFFDSLMRHHRGWVDSMGCASDN